MSGRASPPPVLLYDGDCTFCRRWAERLGRLDRRGLIARVPSRERHGWPGLPPLADAQLAHAMHLVLPGGLVLAGADAVPAILRLLPLPWRLLAPLFRLPGVEPAARQAYAWIAARRHRLGCAPGRCGRG